MKHWWAENWFKFGLLAVLGWSSFTYVRMQENIAYVKCMTELDKPATADMTGLCTVIVTHKFESPWEPL